MDHSKPLFSSDNPAIWITPNTTIVWFRRDLRLSDNAALYHALEENTRVQPVFIFDSVILSALDGTDPRVEFFHASLEAMQIQLEKLGSSLLVLHGDPVEIFGTLNPKAIYTNDDYEPYARLRDGKIRALLELKGVPFKSFKDQVIFAKDEVIKDNGQPYSIFTPYSRKWKANLKTADYKSYPVEKHYDQFQQGKPIPFPSLEQIGFKKSGMPFPGRIIRQSVISQYDRQRDFPAIDGTTRLSVHLRFGTISIRKAVQLALKHNDTWLKELIWREFYQMILWHFPHVDGRAFKPAYDQIEWRNDPHEFERWCQGMTGYPIVDAGMRELNATGFMHNRVRMIVASFLIKHLLIDWRWGEAYFAQKLLDFDLASNNGGWQWAAGSGCDAAPYFRVFNPTLQAKKFDPQNMYIRFWVPELGTDAYPQPIVEHTFARNRAIQTYSNALNKR